MARPKKGRGLFHTRDSGGRHEMTPAAYLRWANKRAEELGVDFCVPEDTIARMIENHQAVCGDVYLDYDVCGNLLSRPALDALKARIDSDHSSTHVFIPRRDRSLASWIMTGPVKIVGTWLRKSSARNCRWLAPGFPLEADLASGFAGGWSDWTGQEFDSYRMVSECAWPVTMWSGCRWRTIIRK